MDKEDLNDILDKHRHWLNTGEGEAADLRGADLRGADLRWDNLRGANLRGADLHGADLRWADLRGAGLRGADLRGADLRGADLRGADLRGADLHGTDLLTFQFQRDQAYCTGERLIIGCEDRSLSEWATDFETIGKSHNYTELQIKAYGQFIQMCIEVVGSNG